MSSETSQWRLGLLVQICVDWPGPMLMKSKPSITYRSWHLEHGSWVHALLEHAKKQACRTRRHGQGRSTDPIFKHPRPGSESPFSSRSTTITVGEQKASPSCRPQSPRKSTFVVLPQLSSVRKETALPMDLLETLEM